MKYDYIEVENYKVEDEKTDAQEINIVVDPVSAITNTIGKLSNSVSEYAQCRQQEETKRSQIRAQMKVGIAKINADKEVLLKNLSYQHEENKMNLKYNHECIMECINQYNKLVDTVIEISKNQNDIQLLIDFMTSTNIFNDIIKLIQNSNYKNNSIELKNNIAGYIE